MKVVKKNLDSGRIQFMCTASSEDVSNAFDVVNTTFCQRNSIAVAEGQTPAEAAKKARGIENLDELTANNALDCLVSLAVDTSGIYPAFPPKPVTSEKLERSKPFEFTLQVLPKPEFELTSYEPVTVTVPPFEIDSTMVDAELKSLAENYATFKPCMSHPIGKQDCALLAIEANQAGQRVDNLCTPGRTYVMGMNLMPKEFEEHLLGMEEGDTKEFSFSVGAEGGQQQPFNVKVTVKQLQEKVVPEITDEWVAKQMPTIKTAKALRENIEQHMKKTASGQYEEMKMSAAAQELCKRFNGKIPDEIYDAMRNSLMENARASAAQQGVPFEKLMQDQGGEKAFLMQLMMQARQMLVGGYTLDALYRHENMTLTEDDILAACRTINPSDASAVRQSMEKSGQGFVLRETAQRLKANVWLLNHANFIEKAPQPKQAEQNSTN